MTAALPIACIALIFGVGAFGYNAARDWLDGRRLGKVEQLAAGLRGDITEIIRDHRRQLADVNRRIDSLLPAEPATRPQPIVRAVPTDTAAVDAVLEHGLAAMAGAMATRGRHRKP